MDRFSQDLNLALDESNSEGQERRKIGVRRRTRSAGNLPIVVSLSVVEDGSSSSPPMAPVITQPLSDSDDSHVIAQLAENRRARYFCHIGHVESDSFNENFSPSRPSNARRKRKFKKNPVDSIADKLTETLKGEDICKAGPSSSARNSPLMLLSKRKNTSKDRNNFNGKRKWSQRDKSECSEMRERSFSGGCASETAFLVKRNEIKNASGDRKNKDISILSVKQAVKIDKHCDIIKPSNLLNAPSLPGSSKFNFVHKSALKDIPTHVANINAYKVSPFCSSSPEASSHARYGTTKKELLSPNKQISHKRDDSNSDMDCLVNDSSSLSSTDTEGIVTNDSDREGDDELTDWPGIEELKVFNKSLSLKTAKANMMNNNNISNALPMVTGSMPPPKRIKKEKALVKSNWASCKNSFKRKKLKIDSGNEDDATMEDSSYGNASTPSAEATTPLQPLDVLGTTSDLVQARSPEVRELRAGCRRIREERPGFLILSSANEELSAFLQDPDQRELHLEALSDAKEKDKLISLATLYSLEFEIVMGRPILRKTSQTNHVEHSYANFPSDHKRRCYGEETEPISEIVPTIQDGD